MSGLDAVVANTDLRWFRHFCPDDQLVVVDEVNFWRPFAQQEFRALQPGQPLFFRLKSPAAAVAGFGFFAVEHALSVPLAWDFFGAKNGDATLLDFAGRIEAYRARTACGRAARTGAKLSCLVLRDAVFLPKRQWIPWGIGEGWSPRVQTYKRYGLEAESGRLLASLLRNLHPLAVPDLRDEFQLVTADTRVRITGDFAQRSGQGTFKVRLLKAYAGRCAITGEHSVPELDAAHIQPYLGPGSNHVQNGLVLRTDLHRLYDGGYVTVTPDLRFEVSGRLRDEFENGKAYYEMAGRRVAVPRDRREQPSQAALLWHAESVFK